MDNTASQGAAGCKPLTTFVQTDTNMFREVVQRLTGQAETTATKELEETKVAGVKRTASKLHERRQYTRPKLEIVKPGFPLKSSASTNHHLPFFSLSESRNYSLPPSPISGNSSLLSTPLTPSTIFSRLCILDEEKRREPTIPELNREEEEKAIKERRFYFHPSPRSIPGYTEPDLLTLFPLESPKTSERV